MRCVRDAVEGRFKWESGGDEGRVLENEDGKPHSEFEEQEAGVLSGRWGSSGAGAGARAGRKEEREGKEGREGGGR